MRVFSALVQTRPSADGTAFTRPAHRTSAAHSGTGHMGTQHRPAQTGAELAVVGGVWKPLSAVAVSSVEVTALTLSTATAVEARVRTGHGRTSPLSAQHLSSPARALLAASSSSGHSLAVHQSRPLEQASLTHRTPTQVRGGVRTVGRRTGFPLTPH